MKTIYIQIILTFSFLGVFAQEDTISTNIYQYNGFLGVGVDTPQTHYILSGFSGIRMVRRYT